MKGKRRKPAKHSATADAATETDARAGGEFHELFQNDPPAKLAELNQRLNDPDLRERGQAAMEEIRSGMEACKAWLESADNLPNLTLPEDQRTRWYHVAEMMGIDPRPLTLRELFAKFKAWADVRRLDAGLHEQAKRRLDSQEDSAKSPAQSPPPTTPDQRLVFELLKRLPVGEAMTGAEIIGALKEEKDIEQSTLTSRIIPFLKQHYGVKNRPGAGYYIAHNA